jgi:mRNA interferase HigB
MNVLAKRTLREFWNREQKAEAPLSAWYQIVEAADWKGPADVKRAFGTNVDFVADNRAIFDIGGNKYHLVVHFACPYGRALIKFVGTHAEYDRIDPESL